MPQQRPSPYEQYGTVGATGDILQDILARREMERMAAQKRAYELYKDAVERQFDDRRINVTEGQLGVNRGTLRQNVREWDEAAPDRAATRRNTLATAGETEYDTRIKGEDRDKVLGLIKTLPSQGRDGLVSPQTIFEMQARGGPKLTEAGAQDALYGPTARGTQEGQKIAATSAGGGLATRQAEAAVDVAKANQIAKGAADAKGEGAGGATNAKQEEYITERKNRIQSSVKDLAGRVSGWTTGWGSLLEYLPATQASNFAADLKELQSAIAFGEITEMRAASKTGGALGSVSEKELALLENALGSLDNWQDPENFKNNLQQIYDSVDRWNDAKQADAASRGVRAGTQGVGTDLMPGLTFDAVSCEWRNKRDAPAAAAPASTRTWKVR